MVEGPQNAKEEERINKGLINKKAKYNGCTVMYCFSHGSHKKFVSILVITKKKQ